MLFKFLPVHAPFILDGVHYLKWMTGVGFRTDNGMLINIPNSVEVEVPNVQNHNSVVPDRRQAA